MTDYSKPFHMDTTMPFCPTCGRENLYRESPEWLLGLFTGIYAKVLAILIDARRKGKRLLLDDIVDRVYADRPARPPKGGNGGVIAAIKRNKEELEHCGWTVLSHRHTRRGYQLVRLEKKIEESD